MSTKPNAIYIMGGGGTAVISGSGYGAVNQVYRQYRDKVGTFYAAIGGMRGALNEDLADVFAWIDAGVDQGDKDYRLNRIKFPSAPVFGTSRHKPDAEDCARLIEVFKAHNIRYVFMNGGNDTMEKCIIIKEYAEKQNYDLKVIGVPKTVDNDILVTHRCPGYGSFAKQVAMTTMSLQADLDSFGLQDNATQGGSVKEGAVAQVVVFMGRDEGWGAAAAVAAKIDESYGPHVILTKEGGFNVDKFLARCQEAWDKHGRLLVVAAEGAHDGEQYVSNYPEITAYRHQLMFKVATDAHKNTSVSDSRLGLFLKMLIEKNLKINTNVYGAMKVREEGPDYLNRNNVEIMSAVDFQDAINVGAKAADIMIGEDRDGVMVTLTWEMGKTAETPLSTVADSSKGSKAMTRSLSVLNEGDNKILSDDGMMINRELYMKYAEHFLDLNGPNRREVLYKEGYKLPLERITWDLIGRKLPAYVKAAKK